MVNFDSLVGYTIRRTPKFIGRKKYFGCVWHEYFNGKDSWTSRTVSWTIEPTSTISTNESAQSQYLIYLACSNDPILSFFFEFDMIIPETNKSIKILEDLNE